MPRHGGLDPGLYAKVAWPRTNGSAAEAALAYLLDDPSPKVRLSLAEGLAMVEHAPRSVVHWTGQKTRSRLPARIIALSPVLSDNDLIEIVASGRSSLQQVRGFRGEVCP
jgi:uncharacterized protein (DUF2336 family)